MILLSSHTIPENTEPIRLLEYVLNTISTIQSRNSAKKAIKKGLIMLDGQSVESGRYIKPGQLIEHFNEIIKPVKLFEKKLDILYEDESLALINKPAGIGVSGNYLRTIQNALPFNIKRSSLSDVILPVPVHRLDNQTSGLLLIAKTQSAAIHLGKQFENKLITKRYKALVIGTPKLLKGSVNSSVEGKESSSSYECIKTVKSFKFKTLTLVDLIPHTGRTHQLRIHMSEQGHSIIGDKLYTEPEYLLKGKGLFLCACFLEFIHPLSEQKMQFDINMPHKFEILMSREEARWERVNTIT